MIEFLGCSGAVEAAARYRQSTGRDLDVLHHDHALVPAPLRQPVLCLEHQAAPALWRTRVAAMLRIDGVPWFILEPRAPGSDPA